MNKPATGSWERSDTSIGSGERWTSSNRSHGLKKDSISYTIAQ